MSHLWYLPVGLLILFKNFYLQDASWETYMQVRKQQLELDMEQQTGSK